MVGKHYPCGAEYSGLCIPIQSGLLIGIEQKAYLGPGIAKGALQTHRSERRVDRGFALASGVLPGAYLTLRVTKQDFHVGPLQADFLKGAAYVRRSRYAADIQTVPVTMPVGIFSQPAKLYGKSRF